MKRSRYIFGPVSGIAIALALVALQACGEGAERADSAIAGPSTQSSEVQDEHRHGFGDGRHKYEAPVTAVMVDGKRLMGDDGMPDGSDIVAVRILTGDRAVKVAGKEVARVIWIETKEDGR